MQQQCALLHTRQGCNGSVLLLIITKLGVNLIRQHKEVVLHTDGSNLLQRLARSNRTRGVRGKIQHQHLGTRGNGSLQFGWIQCKKIINTRLHRLGRTVSHHHRGSVAHIAGLMVQHLIPWIQQTTQRQVNSLAHSHRGQNLTQRVIFHMEEIRHILADSAAQTLQAIVTCVSRMSLLQGRNGSLADIPRGHEIRLANAQGDNILAARSQVEKLTDAGTRHIHDLLGKHLSPVHNHGIMVRRSASGSSAYRRPLFL